MMLPLGTPFDEFMDKVTSRFGSTVMLKLVDEDGIKVSLRDRDDYELAIETPRQSYKGANSRFGALTCNRLMLPIFSLIFCAILSGVAHVFNPPWPSPVQVL
jgi:hypothetical protein